MLIIPAMGWLRQEDEEFKTYLDHAAWPFVRKAKNAVCLLDFQGIVGTVTHISKELPHVVIPEV